VPEQRPTIHASAVLVGAKAVLIRGPSGSGKSRLVLALLQAAQAGQLPFARLVADDRAHVEAVHGRLLVRPAQPLAGLIELRGIGIDRVEAEPVAAVGWVVQVLEQLENNILLRPLTLYNGPDARTYVPLEKR